MKILRNYVLIKSRKNFEKTWRNFRKNFNLNCQFYRKYGFFILNTAFYRAEYGLLSSKPGNTDLLRLFRHLHILYRKTNFSDSQISVPTLTDFSIETLDFSQKVDFSNFLRIFPKKLLFIHLPFYRN